MKYKTEWAKPDEIERKWHLIDAGDQVLGRVATQIASLLIGKHKVNKSPNMDCGDYVVVINSANVKVTGRKGVQKMYRRHSGYPGGFKEITFDKQMKKDSTFVITEAVKNMIPKNKLRDGRMLRLFVYDGATHKHDAQKPVEYKLLSAK